MKPDPDPTKTTARRPSPTVVFPVGFVMIAILLVAASASVIVRTTAERVGEVGRSANAAAALATPSESSHLLAERREAPARQANVGGTADRSARDDVPPPATTTTPEPPPATTTTTAPPPAVPTSTAAPAPNAALAAEDPGTADAAVRVHAAFASAVPENWRHAIPAELRIIPGQSSWATTRGRVYIGSHHAAGDWDRLRAIVAHEFGHLIAFRHGTRTTLGAPPVGWPGPDSSAPERWADCVATAFTGRPLGSHGLPACAGESLRWAGAYLAAGPPG
ncbi:MAG: hypothetical protein OSA99_02475 [Acidimicrobiales bacterium]|nr:hypothetical protein [Acidimicrobiales bacterium]